MKAEDYRDALALIAESDRRQTAHLIEHLAARDLLKLAPPQAGAVVQLAISIGDVEAMLSTHHFEAEYDEDGTMTVFLTPLGGSER
jgi:hypothetical protein